MARNCKVPLMVHHGISTVPTDMSQGKAMAGESNFTTIVPRKFAFLL